MLSTLSPTILRLGGRDDLFGDPHVEQCTACVVGPVDEVGKRNQPRARVEGRDILLERGFLFRVCGADHVEADVVVGGQLPGSLGGVSSGVFTVREQEDGRPARQWLEDALELLQARC